MSHLLNKDESMGIISMIIVGFIVGLLARAIMPGDQKMGIIMTIILGIAGAVVGGFISTFFGMGQVNGFNLGSMVVAIIGAMIVLTVYRKM